MMIDHAAERLIQIARDCGSAQLVVVQDGESVIDEVFDPNPVDVYAVQKGLLSLLIGIAENKYLLEVLDNASHHLDPKWTQLSPWDEASLTIECLLTMTTGMDDLLAPLGEIGRTWRYNNTAYNYLKRMLSTESGLGLNTLTGSWLLEPLAMNDTTWVERNERLPDGRAVTALHSTARDLAKLGMMVLGQGEQLVPGHYIERMIQPGSGENPAWGLCWWNNNQSIYKVPMREDKSFEGPILPDAPPDLVAARGALENGLYVIPSLSMVVARTALPRKSAGFEKRFWTELRASLQAEG